MIVFMLYVFVPRVIVELEPSMEVVVNMPLRPA